MNHNSNLAIIFSACSLVRQFSKFPGKLLAIGTSFCSKVGGVSKPCETSKIELSVKMFNFSVNFFKMRFFLSLTIFTKYSVLVDRVLNTLLKVAAGLENWWTFFEKDFNAFNFTQKRFCCSCFIRNFGLIQKIICIILLIGKNVYETYSDNQSNKDRYCHTVYKVFQNHKEEFIFQ